MYLSGCYCAKFQNSDLKDRIQFFKNRKQHETTIGIEVFIGTLALFILFGGIVMKYPSPYLKMKILGAIQSAEGKTQRERIKNVANMSFTDEDGNLRSFTWKTISTWFYRYKVSGITSVTNYTRSDKGQPRKVTPEELTEAINLALPHFHKKKTYNKMDIYRFCIERRFLDPKRISQSTYFRFLREYDLLTPEAKENQRRLAFSMQYANQLWQADTMFGPYVDTPKGRRQARLIAFIDDASRVLCHGEFFLEENVDALVQATKSAFYKRGLPEQLYVDNGSIYCCQEITLICARVGCILRHTAVRDAAAKGKVERFFRRVRDQFLSKARDLSSLDKLNRQFQDWGENQYNGTLHSALGIKPIDRFGLDLKRIRFLPPSEANDELFYAEAQRKVKKDNTFSFRNQRYETPVDLHDKTIQIRHERHHDGDVIIYYKDQRMGKARKLDPIANGKLQRRKGV